MGTGSKLLLADDSITVQKVVGLTFADEGIEVVAVSDGEQALASLDNSLPDIVLADVFMPKVNGYEVCEYIKKNDRLRHIPVILLVGSFEPFDEAEARRVGADDYLTKPFQSIRQLVQKVGALLGRKSPVESATRELPALLETQAPALPETQASEPPIAIDPSGSIEFNTADTRPLPQPPAASFNRVADLREQSFADLSSEEEILRSAARSEKSLEGIHPATMPTIEPTYNPVPAISANSAEIKSAPIVSQYSVSPSGMSQSVEGDDGLLDLGDVSMDAAMVEADDFILDLQADAVLSSTDVFEAPTIIEISATEYESKSGIEAEQPSDSEDIGILEVSTEMADHEFEAPDELWALAEQAQAEKAPEPVVSAAEPIVQVAEPKASAPVSGGLSPADIEAIARRVVQLMSNEVIERIGWEVVPELAEALIKHQVEDHIGKSR